ncbi:MULTISPECIES: TraM recognition domain-containing protein [Leucobacter]|uniref:Type IV secretory pathway, VirD4 component, TraG/TraD family ATPase n=1 Tax=Leucobacter chromiiresistens TaxID=1079994 RepID=A0A1H0YIZ9_9MICO|nr:TraM recognition domain-containing protein [Leucobacter chromiiresistens]SDQ15209.1 Type IV secretory pathway, VirD4 component, TraG/TraD family ATPase [Leucobacter chromiiresistens]
MSSPDRVAPASEFGRVVRMMGVWQRVVVFIMLPAMLLGVVQAITQAIVLAINGNRDFQVLGVLQYVAQWGRANPAEAYGMAGSVVLHWAVAVLLLGVFGTAAGAIVWWGMKRRKNPQLRAGLASEKDVQRELGTKQLVEQRGPKLRPSLAGKLIKPEWVGYWLGQFRGMDVWSRVEDAIILIGPSRSGKGFRFLLRMILDAPGAVITTSVRLDNAKITMRARERAGSPTLIWAPGVEGGKETGRTLKWDPVAGCVDEETLVRRMNALIPAGAFGGSTSNGGHWDALGKQLAGHLFHAAACGGVGVDEIWGWVMSPTMAQEAARMIREHPEGMPEHADHLEYVLGMPAEQRATSWGVLPTVLAFMGSRAARWWMKPDEEETVDLVDFILRRGSVFIVGDKMAAPEYTRMNDGLLAEFDYITKGIAAASPGSRLDPPVSYVLDEAGNIEYQGMYEIITAGGGYGRVVVATFQSKNQLEQFGDNQVGATLWDAAPTKIILPGGGDTKALEEISNLIGDVWVERQSQTLGSGDPSAQYSTEQRAAFSKKEIREMDLDYAFVFYRNLSPVVIRTKPFTEHPRFAECMKDAEQVDASFRETSRYTEQIAEHANARA